MLVEKEKLNLFRDYLTETEQSVVEWLDERVKNSPECPICKANRFNTEFVVTREDKYAYTDNRKKEPAKYRECKSCGVMILNDTQDYEKIYSDGTYYSVNGVPTDFLKRRFKELLTFPEDKSDNLKRIKRIKSFLKTEPHFNTPGTKKVLDVGAGLGIFLYQFLDNSWEGTAVDPSPNACVHMKTVLDSVRVVNGFIEDIPPQNKFDLITINRVLEHVFNPFKMLNSIKNYLKDNGVLYLELPDVMSYYKDGHNNEAFGYGHYLVYSPTSLLLLTSKTGFELISMSREIEPSSKFTLYGFFRKK